VKGQSSRRNGEESRVRLVPLKGNSFRFRCHKEIDCFTKCCAQLNLVLTPYDILRLKKRLGMSSGEFLNQYTETRIEGRSRFPTVMLKMKEEDGKVCPFVSPDGCTVYEDRPSACRIYPIGRGTLKPDRERETRVKFFLVKEEHCLGFEEHREWTIEQWMADQGLSEYNTMNDEWSEIVTSTRSLGPAQVIERKLRMFSMASYNLDKFREFIFKSRFFELFEIPQEEKERLAADDLSLLQFSTRWLKFSLFGEKTIMIKKSRASAGLD